MIYLVTLLVLIYKRVRLHVYAPNFLDFIRILERRSDSHRVAAACVFFYICTVCVYIYVCYYYLSGNVVLQ
jgi:hypothetical protein